MKVIGIVGGMGAGKSTVSALIRTLLPVSYISADEVGHDILLKGHEAYLEVVQHFGTDILDEKGEIIRKRLGEKVFSDSEKLKTLNQITHPVILKLVKEKIATFQKTAPQQLIILEAALLLETGLAALTDKIIAVYASPEVRLERVKLREGLPKEQILHRFKAQKEWEQMKAAADYIIDNSFTIEETKKQLASLVAVLQKEEGIQ